MNISWDRLNAIFQHGGSEALNEEWDRLFEEFLQSIPEERREQHRIRQFAYKRELNIIKNNYVRAIVAQTKMMNSLFELNEVLAHTSEFKKNRKNAKVINFVNKQKQ